MVVSQPQRNVLMVIMDGVGVSDQTFGNAVKLAKLPNLQALERDSLYRTLYAHGTAVGMPADSDLGNSEVGHNAIGAGRIFDQGAKLVKAAIDNSSIFHGETWLKIKDQLVKNGQTLHFIGLLSDGNVHSHEEHLYSLIRQAKLDGIKRVRLHILLDGRDVGEKTAEIYAARLAKVLKEVRDDNFDICVASGGGRMNVTMDRYEADWSIVERGWQAHVLGMAPNMFSSLEEAISTFRKDGITDQYMPPFVVTDAKGMAAGKIEDGDAVVLFNFRGDRAVELCRAFEEGDFDKFDRVRRPQAFFAGMMEYDGDLKIPPHFLVAPPVFDNTLGEYLTELKLRQFACSETQKFGHVTYFWNGNRSGMFDSSLETYVEVPSDRIEFDQAPAMKAAEITSVAIEQMHAHSFDFGRINLANGDMVGHTGNLSAAVTAMETVDTQIGRLRAAADQFGVMLIVTADHGNCEEMFDAKAKDYPNWSVNDPVQPKPKTSHTLNPVPVYIYVPKSLPWHFRLKSDLAQAGLANFANTVLVMLGQKPRDLYLPSLVDEVARV